MKQFFNIINSSVQFGASLAGCVSFLGLAYAFIFPAKAAEKWVDIQSAYEQVRLDMQSMTSDLSTISQNSADIETNTGAIAGAVKDKLDWQFDFGASYGNQFGLHNVTNYPAKVVVSVEGLQSKFWGKKETRENLLKFEAIVPASERKFFTLSEIRGERWDFPALIDSYSENAFKTENYSATICVHTEFLTGDMPKLIERRTYVDKRSLAGYELFEGNASECR